MNVMLLAAGEGTRLRPYTNQLPKPAIPFLTLPLAAHSLGFLQDLPLNKLVVNTYHLPNKIHTLFNNLSHGAKELIFSDEKGEILGSGGGLSKARSHFQGGGDFLMMNADEVILPKDSEVLSKAIQQHKSSGALATILVMKHPEVGTQFGGVWADDSLTVKGFGKSVVAGSTHGWHFIGVQILSDRVFKYLPETGVSNILYDGLVAGIADGQKVQVFPFECTWFETGNPKDFLEASKHSLEILMGPNSPEKSALQKTFQKFANSKLRTQNFSNALMHFSAEAIIDTSSKYSGIVCVGSGSSIAEGCNLENVIVGDGVHVTAGTAAANTMLL
ncbi:MAG: NTP transferase domain-containing protein [Bdellovibrio sp.]|nr:NTP transferase domain-containing protein [Bdellovibrio sp.]